MPSRRNSFLKDHLLSLYDTLHKRFGHRNWWPAQSPFEVCVGAVLTQNTAWKNVVKAIDNLKAASLMDPLSLHSTLPDDLAEIIRPSGYYNVKARRLKNFVEHLVVRHNADLGAMFGPGVKQLRNELLSINGVGKETADSMILYGAGKPIFVVDAYTRRVLVRHSLVDEKADYDTIQELFHENLPTDAGLFNDYHAQFVAVGHHHCKAKPMCGECPLNIYLNGRGHGTIRGRG